MVDLEGDKPRIIHFMKETFEKFCTQFGRPSSIAITCLPSRVDLVFHGNLQNKIRPGDLSSKRFERRDFGSFHSDEWMKEFNKTTSRWRYFEQAGVIEISGKDRVREINHFYSKHLWYIIREATHEIILPTTLLEMEIERYSSIILDSAMERLGRMVVAQMRDEPYDSYIREKNEILKTGYKKYVKSLNPHRDPGYNKLDKERAELFGELSPKQRDALDRLMLRQLDSVAFNTMKFWDENNAENSGMQFTVDGKDVVNLPMVGNGNLSGEYLDWIERFSKYGTFQS